MLASGLIDRRVLLACGPLVLIAAVCACPTPASAACGDYVTVIRPGDHHEPADPAKMPGPACHGPGCSTPPSQATTIPVPKSVSRPGLDLLATAQADPAPPGAARVPELEQVATSASPSSIFHPPRFS